MAAFAALDYRIEVNGVDMSSHLKECDLPIETAELETTTFGSAGGWRSRIAGLKDASVTLKFNQNFAASTVDAVLWPLLGTVVTLKVRPTTAAVSATNPEYQTSVLVSKIQPFTGAVGDLAEQSVQWPITGTITRAVV